MGCPRTAGIGFKTESAPPDGRPRGKPRNDGTLARPGPLSPLTSEPLTETPPRLRGGVGSSAGFGLRTDIACALAHKWLQQQRLALVALPGEFSGS